MPSDGLTTFRHTGATFGLQKIDQFLQDRVLGRTVKCPADAVFFNEPDGHQARYVMRQGGAGYAEGFLDLAHRYTGGAHLDQVTENGQPGGIAQFRQSFCCILMFHATTIKAEWFFVNYIFRNIEM